MLRDRFILWVVVMGAALLVSCRPAPRVAAVPTVSPTQVVPSPTASPRPTSTSIPTSRPTSTSIPTSRPTSTSRPVASPTSSEAPSGALAWPPDLRLPYTFTGDADTGRIRGRLFYPSEFIPALTVYAVAVGGGRFYRVDTEAVPTGLPRYEITGVSPGLYHIYAYPTGGWAEFGGAYSYLAACEANHWQRPQACADFLEDSRIHDLVPVEVQAGRAVEEIDIYDWYGPSLPPPPDM